MLTLHEKWAKVQSLNVKDSTVAELTSKLGPPYRSNDGETKRSRFWYPFEGVTSDNKSETAPMLIVILNDEGEITSYLRSEPVAQTGAPTLILPREYKLKIDGKWKRRDLKTGKVVDE